MVDIDLTGVRSTQWRNIFLALADDNVSELEVNGPDSVWIMTHGRRERLGATIGQPVAWADVTDFERTMGDVESHTAHYGHSFADAFCIWEGGLRLKGADGRLAVKARFHSVKPPVCDFPIVTIAKQSTSLTGLDTICKAGSMSVEMMQFIKVLIKTKQTIVFSGGTGAGKTTFMTACCNEMDPTERVGIYEDAPELDISAKIPNTFNMMSFPAAPGVDPNSQADLDWCVRQAQRQRVDRILIGESRGPEFQGFLTAANSGFNGSMTTMHANTPRMALDKMASFLKRAPGNASTPMSSINKDLAMSIDYIIQLGRPGKKYRTIAIEEISNIVGDTDSAKIKTNPIYAYNEATDSWERKGYPENDVLREAMNKIVAGAGQQAAGRQAPQAPDPSASTPVSQQSFMQGGRPGSFGRGGRFSRRF